MSGRRLAINLDFTHLPLRSLLVSKEVEEASVRRWAVIFAVAGALWMILVLWFGSLRLVILSNYPGAFAARWVHYRRIAPSPPLINAFNAWLLLTRALQ